MSLVLKNPTSFHSMRSLTLQKNPGSQPSRYFLWPWSEILTLHQNQETGWIVGGIVEK